MNRAIRVFVPVAFLFLVPAIAHAQSDLLLRNAGAGTCLDANAQQAFNGGAIIQWPCNGADPFQQWNILEVGDGHFMIENQGAGTCLDANAHQAFNGGAIIQWQCNMADPFQLWYLTPASGGRLLSMKNFGASNVSASPSIGLCLDAHAQQVFAGGAIIQYGCDVGDPYQLWQLQ
jgi:hypothetical protein